MISSSTRRNWQQRESEQIGAITYYLIFLRGGKVVENQGEEAKRVSSDPGSAVPEMTPPSANTEPAVRPEPAPQQNPAGPAGPASKFFGIGFRNSDFEFLYDAITDLLSEQGLTEEEARRVRAAFDRYKPALFKEYRRTVVLPAEANLDETQTKVVIDTLLENGSDICQHYSAVLTEAALCIVSLLAAIEKPPR